MRRSRFHALEAVRADKLGELPVPMGGSHPNGAHFVKFHVKAAGSKLQGRFAAGKPRTDHAHPHQLTFTDW